MVAYSPAQLDLARRLGPATLHEAAGRIGSLPSTIKPVRSDMIVCGPAFTVQCPPLSNLQIHHAIYHAPPGAVLVVSVGGGAEAGYWGDVLNAAAQARGLGGLVIDGGVRDVTGLRADDFPVFSNGVCLRGTGKDYEAVAWLQQPLRIGEVVVAPNDLVIGDADGVVVLPAAAVAEALTKGEAREADERDKIAALRAGARTLDLYGFADGAPDAIDPAAPFRGAV